MFLENVVFKVTYNIKQTQKIVIRKTKLRISECMEYKNIITAKTVELLDLNAGNFVDGR